MHSLMKKKKEEEGGRGGTCGEGNKKYHAAIEGVYFHRRRRG